MAPKHLRSRRHHLLPHLPALSSQLVHYSPSPFTRTRRHLQLRGPILLLSRHAHAAPTSPDVHIHLSASLLPSAHGSRAAVLGSSSYPRLTFRSPPARDVFVRHAARAVAADRSGIHRYGLVHELDHRASGAVHRVMRKADGRLLALKTVAKVDVRASQGKLRRLVAERLVLGGAASAACAFVVKLVDAFETADHFCFVLEFGRFGDLEDVLQRMPKGRLPEDVARDVFSEIVLAVEECHRMGFLHRDVKPANVLLTREGHVRLTDFALAKELRVEREGSSGEDSEEEEFKIVGRAYSFVGTRRFMCPQKLTGRQDARRGYGAPSDVWALGVTLFVMLTGSYPFGRNVSTRNARAVFQATQNEELVIPGEVGEEAAGLLRGMLCKDAGKRLGLAGVKRHRWFRGVDWATVTEECRAGSVRKRVVQALEEGGVESRDMVRYDARNVVSEVDLFTSAFQIGRLGEAAREKEVEEVELIGFGYREEFEEGLGK
ncbi:Serine/threonine protein kinase Mitochondrial [Chondrus crispus]|uniref:non-specific serine/threonine protein kinase n=1 Tax=Chondrus crispus TaxID=2769 RepID=R7QLA1_CHOCR|nr:Serine/threonine protein kinase Mitochondrial [Chondrus crispus]CDF38864.1 Serine/threonine protein kinase Mitochondrial [Chondrus crispus]|eukprot:XP_005718769.1 Serine/threonine protein kinase Mitochondrial [Chondrus crispus]